MKKFIFALVALFALSSTAMAQDSCSGDTCVNTTPPLNNLLTIDIVGLGALANIGEVNGMGDIFDAAVYEDTELEIGTWVSGQTNLCGPGCTDFTVYFDGTAENNLYTYGEALGTTPGESVGLMSASQALNQLGFSLNVGGDLSDGG